MTFQRTELVVFSTLTIALLAMLPRAAFPQSLVEVALQSPIYAIGDSPRNDLEVCAANFSKNSQSAMFAFVPANLSIYSERIVLDLEPGETKCQTFTPKAAGTLNRIIQLPKGLFRDRADTDVMYLNEAPDILKVLPKLFVQVWLLGDGGLRTAQVAVTCPTPSGVCPSLYRVVGNDPGTP